MHLTSAEVIHALKYIVNNWSTIGAYGLGGVTIAGLAHSVERRYGNLSLQKVGYTIVALGSLLGVLAQFSLHAHSVAANWHAIPTNLGILSSASLFLHKFLVSGSFEVVATKLSNVSDKIKEVEDAVQQIEAKQPLPAEVNPPNDNQFIG